MSEPPATTLSLLLFSLFDACAATLDQDDQHDHEEHSGDNPDSVELSIAIPLS